MPVYGFLTLVTLLASLASTGIVSAHVKGQTLTGEWTSDCLPIGKNGRHGVVTRVRITGREIVATSQVYAKSSCQMPTVQVNYRGALSDVAVKERYIDFTHTVQTITFTPNIDDVVRHYNNAADGAGCGLKDWNTNIAASVAGRTCTPFSFASAGVMLYERAWLDDDDLRFGNFPFLWSAVTEADRPSKPADLILHRTGN